MMPVTVDQFLKHLGDSGILSSDDVLGVRSKIPEDKRGNDATRLAHELVRQRKLTLFQAEALCREPPHGLTLGNYVLLEKIGAGGMGMVYKAEHRRMKRIVAIKTLSAAALKDPDVIKRFHREVEAAAKLTHVNVVAAHDADEFHGVHFLVMEFVDGVDLARHIRERGPLKIEQAVDYIQQAARGLEHAHRRGIVHRDIKPANLLLDSSGVIKILDMGLARFHDPEGASANTAEIATLTQVGSVMGTVDFMSPEQALDSRQADAASDIYSLGATFYYLLTARAMYDGDTIMKRILAHREAPIPSIASVRPEAPPAIDGIFRKMVAKKKEARYASVSDLLRDLGDWRNAAPGIAGEPDSSIPQNVIKAIFDDE